MIPFMLGVFSLILAYLPIYSKLFTVLGVLLGIIGILLSRKKEKKSFKFSLVLCSIATVLSSLMFLYVNVSIY